MSRGCRETEYRGGFTLIEVLVALAIVVLALGSLLEIFSTSLRGVRRAEAYTEAVLLAESKLAAMGIETPLEEGGQRGRFDDRFRWRTTVRPFTHRPDAIRKEDSLAAYEVDITVLWGTGKEDRSVSLTTVRLVPPR